MQANCRGRQLGKLYKIAHGNLYFCDTVIILDKDVLLDVI